MAFREVSVVQIKEALRRWLKGEGERPIANGIGVDRKTARRYITAAIELGLDRHGGEEQLTDELIGQMVERVRPHRPDGHGEAWRVLLAEEKRIKDWVNDGLTVVKIGILLRRRGDRGPAPHPRALRRRALRCRPAHRRRCGWTTRRLASSARWTSAVSGSFPTASVAVSAGRSSSRRVTAATSSCGRRFARRPRR